jgi:hypothetical protein
MQDYIKGKWRDEQQVHVLNESDMLIEEFFLRLRTREGIADIATFTPLLVPNHESLLENYKNE